MKKFLAKILILNAIIPMIALSSCHSSKQAAAASGNTSTSTSTSTSISTSGSVISNSGATSLPGRYKRLTGSWKSWNELEMGMKVQLTSPSRLNASGKAYMKRNEWISISIRMIGFEVATLWADKDSIVAVDKFHKKYVSVPTASVLGKSGITLANLQDMLLGRAFLAGGTEAKPDMADDFTFTSAENGWYILPRRQPEGLDYGFLASSTENALRGMVLDIINVGTIEARYNDNYESRNCGWFAREVSVENSKGKRIAVTLKWDINSAKFNSGSPRSLSIPADCEKIPMSTLTSLLKNF